MNVAWKITIGLLVCLGGLWLSGCHKPLFPEDQPKSPYERYGSLRGHAKMDKTLDIYGNEKPNLRERLKPMSER